MAVSSLTQTQLSITNLDEVVKLLKTSHFLERNWLNLGLELGLLKNTLDTVEAQHGTDVARCLLECLSLWLRREDKVDEKGGPTWDTLAAGLSQIGEKVSADSARQKELLQKYLKALSESMINPVKMSRLLFSKRCISEATLDEMETLEGTLDEKKTFLLSAIHKAVSSELKKLKLLATVLSKFEETKHLADKINNEYSQKFPDDQTTLANIQEVTITAHSDQMSHEDCASDILRHHYSTLSQSLQYPITIAQQLQGEGIISEEILTFVKSAAQSSSEGKATFILLKAVRRAVYTKYSNLELFASVLLKFTNSVQCANDILKDCETLLPPNDDISEEQPNNSTNNSSVLTEDESLENVPLPRSLSSVFGSFRKKFAISFNKIREAINANPPPLDKLKLFLEDGYSHLRPELDCSNTIDEMLTIVRKNCTLINISCLEAIVERFDIKEAETHLQTYRDDVKKSCMKMKASLCLNENLKVTRTPSLLQCETAVFVLKWDPVGCTLEDIEEILSESLGRNVEIRKVVKGNSIIVTCFFPLSLTTILIARAQETLELMKKKGLIKLTIGYCTVYDKRTDEEITSFNQSLDPNQIQLHQLEHQIQNEKEKNLQLEVRLSQKESQLQQQLQRRKSDSNSWEQYIDEMEKEMERVQVELKALRAKNQDFQTENHQLMTERNRAAEEQDRLKKNLEQIRNSKEYFKEAQMWKEQFESAQRDFELEEKVREKEAQAAQALRQNRDSLQREVDELRRRVTEQKSVLQALQYSFEREVDELRRRVTQHFTRYLYFGFTGTGGAVTEPLGSHRMDDPYLHIPVPSREQGPDYKSNIYIPPARPSGEKGYHHPMRQGSLPIPHRVQSPDHWDEGYIPHARPSAIRHDSGIMSSPNTTELYVHDMKEPSHSDNQRESYNQPVIKDQGFTPQPYHSEEHQPMKPPVPLQASYHHPMRQGSLPIPHRVQSPDHWDEDYIPQARPSAIRHDSGIMSSPNTTEFNVHGMKEPSQSDNQRESYNQQRPRQNVTAQEYRHQMTPKYENVRPGQPFGGNQFPPSDPQPWQQPKQGGVVLPGEIPNLAKPPMSCPLCGRADFATQTELEIHCAKCD